MVSSTRLLDPTDWFLPLPLSVLSLQCTGLARAALGGAKVLFDRLPRAVVGCGHGGRGRSWIYQRRLAVSAVGAAGRAPRGASRLGGQHDRSIHSRRASETAAYRRISRPTKRTLLRRVTFDLTGLPPTPEEVEAFLADRSPLAYERVVDRLLASPRFGERWARHWLDVVRFADTAGFKRDFLRPDAYRYRDYVIRAFNSDLPYDRFVRQQIAGDELEPGNPDALIATGLLRLYPEEATASDFVKQRQDMLDDVTEVTGLTFLGITLGCAKCHDHKFDPIEQTDFFRLQACFSGMVPRDDLARRSCPRCSGAITSSKRLGSKRRPMFGGKSISSRRPFCSAVMEETTQAYDPETRQSWYTPEEKRTTRQRQLVALSARFRHAPDDAADQPARRRCQSKIRRAASRAGRNSMRSSPRRFRRRWR